MSSGEAADTEEVWVPEAPRPSFAGNVGRVLLRGAVFVPLLGLATAGVRLTLGDEAQDAGYFALAAAAAVPAHAVELAYSRPEASCARSAAAAVVSCPAIVAWLALLGLQFFYARSALHGAGASPDVAAGAFATLERASSVAGWLVVALAAAFPVLLAARFRAARLPAQVALVLAFGPLVAWIPAGEFLSHFPASHAQRFVAEGLGWMALLPVAGAVADALEGAIVRKLRPKAALSREAPTRAAWLAGLALALAAFLGTAGFRHRVSHVVNDLAARTQGGTVQAHPPGVMVMALGLVPGSDRVLSGAGDGSLALSVAALGSTQALAPFPVRVRSVAVSPDGTLAVVAGDQPTFAVVPLTGGAARFLPGLQNGANAVAFSSSGELCAVGGDDVEDSAILVLSTRTWQTLRRIEAPAGTVWNLAFGPDETLIATSSNHDGEIRLFSVATGRVERSLVGGSTKAHGLAWSRAGDRIASADWNGRVRIWSAADPQGLPERVLQTEGRIVTSLAFSPDGAWLAASGSFVELFEVTTGRSIDLTGGLRTAPSVAAVAFDPAGDLVAGTTDGGIVRYRLSELLRGR